MASEPALIAFPSRDAMAARIADFVEAELSHALCERGEGLMAVSGGSTPKALYETLARRPLAWEHVRLTLVDERWVPLSHPRSNEAFIRQCFSSAPVRIDGLFAPALDAQSAVPEIAGRIGGRPFDLAVLGMGDDGHTASWFPHARGLEAALSSDAALCAVEAVRSAVTGEETTRMTLTLSALRSARRIVLLITGATKRAAFENAMANGPVEDMPVRAILRARPDLWVCWAP